MEIRKMKLSELTPAEYNPRVELKPGDQEWEALDESIGNFGYVEPIVWNERTGNIVGGHQRRNVLLARGVEEEDISVVNLSPEDEKILNVLLNKSKGIWDVAKLVALIDEIKAAGGNLKATGFTELEISLMGEDFGHIEDLLKEDFSDVGKKESDTILQHEVIPREIGDDAADNNAVSAPFRFRSPLQQHHIPRGRRRRTMRTWKGPKLPRGLLHEMFEVHEDGGYYDKQNGGQWVPGEASEEAFQGVVMPLNNEDLKYMDAGTYTINAQKVYTNGHTLRVGAQFRDGYDGQLYTVKQELTHGPVHALKRYMVEKKGASNPK